MKTKLHIKKTAYGVTLVETMVALAILLVAVTGAMSYQYYTAVDARKADFRMEAARLALTLLEGWKGAGGATDFDPRTDFAGDKGSEFAAEIGVWDDGSGNPPPGMSTVAGKYSVTTEKNTYFMILSYTDESLTDNIPMAMNVLVMWNPQGAASGSFSDASSSLSLTTYEGS